MLQAVLGSLRKVERFDSTTKVVDLFGGEVVWRNDFAGFCAQVENHGSASDLAGGEELFGLGTVTT